MPRRGYRFFPAVTTQPVSGSPFKVRGQKQHDVQTQDSVLRTPHSASTLVGRDSELTQLHQRLAKALTGERQIVFVTGEPGIGKTALVETFLEGIRRWELEAGFSSPQLNPRFGLPTPSCWAVWGQCVEHHGAGEAFLPILDALGRLARGSEGEHLVAILRRYAPMWLVQLPAFIESQELETLQRKVQGASRERMLREFAEALESLTAEAPLVLVLEDLHWSDVSTLDLLAFLTRRKEPARLLVLGTYRPVEMLDNGHPLKSVTQELYAHAQAAEVSLGVLSEGAIAHYLTARFQIHSPLSGEGQGEGYEGSRRQKLVRTLHQRTGGNPMFLVSLVNDLIERGALVQINTGCDVQENSGAIENMVPDSIRYLAARQSGRLSLAERHTLEAASVAGLEFSAAAVAAAVATDTAIVECHCDQLAERQQFLKRLGVEEWPDGTLAARYGFLHALYQQLWHERVLPTQLQRFPVWLAYAMVARGSALVGQGQVEEGIAQMHQGLASCQIMELELVRIGILPWLAAAYAKVGRIEEGLSVVAEALATVDKTGARYCEAELYRLKGILTLQAKCNVQGSKLVLSEVAGCKVTNSPESEAEGCFLKAIEIAQKQRAKSLELRAVMSLARLWQQHGKQKEAHELLSKIYTWFTEGFDTKNLQEAKALLEELGH